MPKANILVVGTYTRSDYLEQFKASLNDFNFFFLEYVSSKEETNNHYTSFGRAVYWSDYQNAFDLLDQLKPIKVLFIFIEAYKHVALNAACQVRGIPSFVVDHGILDTDINFRLEEYLKRQPSPKSLKSKAMFSLLLLGRFKSRLFLLNTIKLLPAALQEDVKRFIAIRKKLHFEEAIKRERFLTRLPNFYITFSKRNLRFHMQQNGHIKQEQVFFTGIPSFDHLAGIAPTSAIKNPILFIDQPLATKELFGWTMERHSNFTKLLASICKREGYELFVKLHPLQSQQEKRHWLRNGGAEVIDEEGVKRLLPISRIVIGFFSTLLLPLAATPHTTVLTLENHPIGRLDVSKSFIDAGVAHPVYDLTADLPWALENIGTLHRRQLPNKQKFEEEWLYRFDGKSGERLRSILHSTPL